MIGLGQDVWIGQTPYRPVRDTDVKSPSDLFAIGDVPVEHWPNGWFIGVAEYHPILEYKYYPIQKLPHGQVFNMVIADGHTEGVKTNMLFGTNSVQKARWNNDNQP